GINITRPVNSLSNSVVINDKYSCCVVIFSKRSSLLISNGINGIIAVSTYSFAPTNISTFNVDHFIHIILYVDLISFDSSLIIQIKTTSVNWWFALRLKAFVTGLGLKGPLNGLPFCTTLTR